MFSIFFKQYKLIIMIVSVLAVLGLVVYSYKYTYDKAYIVGFDKAQSELNIAYQTSLENKLKEQKETLEKNFEILLNAEEQKKKIETIYIDRIRTVKEIVKAENLKCEMTDEQRENLNTLTRGVK